MVAARASVTRSDGGTDVTAASPRSARRHGGGRDGRDDAGRRRCPASLLAVVVATVVAQLGLDVARIGALPGSLPLPALPHASASESASCVGRLRGRRAGGDREPAVGEGRRRDGRPARHDPDRELFGQGLANLVSPLFGGMPATGAIARTAVNVRAGARTRAGGGRPRRRALLVVLFLGGLVAQIPLAALAGVLMVTAVRMVELHNVSAVLRSTRPTPGARAHRDGDGRVRPHRRGRDRRRRRGCARAANVARSSALQLEPLPRPPRSSDDAKPSCCTTTSSSTGSTAPCSSVPRNGSSPSSPPSPTSGS